MIAPTFRCVQGQATFTVPEGETVQVFVRDGASRLEYATGYTADELDDTARECTGAELVEELAYVSPYPSRVRQVYVYDAATETYWETELAETRA